MKLPGPSPQLTIVGIIFLAALVNLLVGNVYTHPHDRLFEAMGELCELPEPRALRG